MNANLEFSIVYCPECNMPFAITLHLLQKLQRSHDNFYCPLKHEQHFPQKSNEDKLHEKLHERNNEILSLRREIEGLKKPKKRIKKAVK